MFQNILGRVKKCKTLKYVYLQTGTKYYGMHLGPEKGLITPSRENNPRLTGPNFHYDLEDHLKKEAEGGYFTYNIVRPPVIIGFTTKTAMNFGVNLAVYACILKQLKKPLLFPYNEKCYNALREFADAKLVTSFILWLTPIECDRNLTANEVFNIQNGDYFRMKDLWPRIARYFGMEAKLADKPFNVQQYMKDKGSTWNEIVSKHSLKKYSIEDLGSFDSFDQVLGREWDECTLIQKAVKSGYTRQVNTEKMFTSFFDGLKNCQIIPDFEVASTTQ